MVAPARRSSEPRGSAHSLRREAGALGIAVAGLLLALAVVSYQPGARSNLVGPLGAALADVLVQAVGVAAFLVPAALLAAAAALFVDAWPGLGSLRAAAALGALLAAATLAELLLGSWRGMEAGGVIGGFLHAVLRDGCGEAGAWLISLAGLTLLLAVATGRSVLGLGAAAGRGGTVLARSVWRRAVRRRVEGSAAVGEPILLRRSHEVAPENVLRPGVARRPPVVIADPPAARPAAAKPARGKRQIEMPFRSGESYCLPDASLLEAPMERHEAVDRDALVATSRVLEAKLATFDIHGEVRNILPGPVITTYEFEPAPGIKVGRIVALTDDLMMAMRAMSVRILAPIPGKPYVGIEVSNTRREKVLLREIVTSDAFTHSSSPLTLALGKDTNGEPVAADLARMPHLLVAGATGAGKSVFLNTLITSILMRATPRDVRFVMIDPKMIELATYEQIPHLLVPVVTEAKPAVAVINNLVQEMEERYRLLRDKGVRNIETYNRLLAEDGASSEPIELDDDSAEPGEGDEGSAEAESAGATRPVHQHLPRIVVIVDELADLITTRRDCEEPIQRLAQKARAAGIHLVLATQRPSVDIITGVIKANFPARISFKVRGKVDSRTILDGMGAENLLGEGDMLFLPPGTSMLRRLHGAYVSDAEIERIVKFVARQEPQSYRMELLADPEEDDADLPDAEGGDEAYDERYDEAVRIVTETGKASISYVQRRLNVGYNRAARMVECMEREGVLSPADHRGVREILARRIDG